MKGQKQNLFKRFIFLALILLINASDLHALQHHNDDSSKNCALCKLVASQDIAKVFLPPSIEIPQPQFFIVYKEKEYKSSTPCVGFIYSDEKYFNKPPPGDV